MGGEFVIAAKRVVADGPDGGRLLEPGLVRIVDGVVAEVRRGRPDGVPDVQLLAGFLAPGLIDLQVNGYFGVDLVDADPGGWARVAEGLPRTGVTAFVPTFISAPVPVLVDALRRTADLLPRLRDGARVLGVHVEGPFLSRRHKGAHNEAWLTDPDPKSVLALVEAGRDLLSIVTLAPERTGALDAVRTLAEAGVLVSLGHSDATADQARAAADAGARKVTHLFNAQRPLHHREPGLAGQALTDPRLASGLIVDLHHVAGPVCRLALAAAPGRICLVTDAVSAAGMPPGEYVLGDRRVTMGETGSPVLPDGTLAGSTLRLDEAVGNLVGLGVDPVAAVDAATRVPADLVGRGDLGRIAPGAPADLVWLDDELRARKTWIGGTPVFGDAP
ncbi:MAG: N-acetylglucosamine-6-phosphate deacetylase [Streptosporangiales bacterium]|nr:N-acetylglucosamine-6-phosphate deacetylase [Streptosporangiales bacterium]